MDRSKPLPTSLQNEFIPEEVLLSLTNAANAGPCPENLLPPKKIKTPKVCVCVCVCVCVWECVCVCVCVCVCQSLSCVQLFATPWTYSDVPHVYSSFVFTFCSFTKRNVKWSMLSLAQFSLGFSPLTKPFMWRKLLIQDSDYSVTFYITRNHARWLCKLWFWLE